MVRVHIFVSGRVQGVFFRDNTKRKAEELGIFGWVKNLPDDKVEAIFEGERGKVEEIIEWTKKGPSMAQVAGVEVEWQEYKGEFNDFCILR